MTSESPYYWTTREAITVSAWYPYAETMPVDVVLEDQSIRKNYVASDFISAEGQNVDFNTPASLKFSHRTARITLNLQAGAGVDNVADAAISLLNLTTDNGNPAAIRPYNPEGDTYDALLVPQTIASDREFIRIELNGNVHTARLSKETEMKAGFVYTYNVTVTDKGLKVEEGSILNWTEGGSETGIASVMNYDYDASSNTYTVYTAEGLYYWAEAARNDLSTNCILAANIPLEIPAENGSNTLYIKEMEKEGASTVKVTLQAAPDAEAKAYAMALSFSYDGVSSKQAYTTEESITLPIQQRIRIKCDEPLVYDEPWVGQTAAVGVSLYNMGKSSIYNCMVTVEGEGLSMPETYFGGNIASGGTMRAEFDVQTDVAGDIAGEVVISYEDVYGEQMQERLPLQMFVNEQIAIDPVLEDGAMAGGMEDSYADPAMGYADDGMSGGMGGAEGREGIAWYWWALAIAAVSAGVVVLGIRRHRQRKKELEAL